jgi:hypothetical protein
MLDLGSGLCPSGLCCAAGHIAHMYASGACLRFSQSWTVQAGKAACARIGAGALRRNERSPSSLSLRCKRSHRHDRQQGAGSKAVDKSGAGLAQLEPKPLALAGQAA